MTTKHSIHDFSEEAKLEHAAKAQVINNAKKQEFILQFISQETGRRSQPFTSDWDDLRTTLQHMETTEHTIQPNDYILLVALLNGDDTQIPTMPLITIENFLNIPGENS